MAEDAVSIVDPPTVLDVLPELCRIGGLEVPERVLALVEVDLLVVDAAGLGEDDLIEVNRLALCIE